jgi:parvulin-like peptidyl-prolyl isomerase
MHRAALVATALIAALALRLATAQQPSPPPKRERFQPWDVVATVGDQIILYGDVAPSVNQIIEEARSKAKTPEELRQLDEQIEPAREALTRRIIGTLVEIKLKYLAFERDMHKQVTDVKKRAEALKTTDQKVREQFEKSLAEMRTKVTGAKQEQIQEMLQRDPILPRLAMLMRDHHAESLAELDAILRQYGSSLEKQVRLYGEDQLGRSMVSRNVNFNPEVTHQEMLDYYEKHAAEYALPAKARFEMLTVRFSSFPDKAAARRAIEEMGNAVFFGTPFAAVARQRSQEPNAAKGGEYDWVTQGSLASEPIDRALFTLEPGKLSQIIEDNVGYHIIRVKERHAAGQVSFLEAQDKIKEAIQLEKKMDDYKKFVESLRARTTVWTIYDATAVASQPTGTSKR